LDIKIKSEKHLIRNKLKPLYKYAENFFFLIRANNIKINSREHGCYSQAVQKFENSLDSLQYDGDIESYKKALLDFGFFKKKYYTYGSYLATFSTMPILAKVLNDSEIVDSIFAKTSMVTSTKMMDNINDELHNYDSAIEGVNKLLPALIYGKYKASDTLSTIQWLIRSENIALKIASWTGQILKTLEEKAPASFSIFIKDVLRWGKGQKDSFINKRNDTYKSFPTTKDYLEKISEKSFGSLWADPDLCFLEKALGSDSAEMKIKLNILRDNSDLLMKSCQIYDDVVDFNNDVKTNSVNLLLITAYEKGMVQNIGKIAKEDPKSLLTILYKNGIVK
jgi:hypothetical protein